MAFVTLTSQQRGLLSRAVTAARREAEAGAHEALQALGVDHHEPFGHMTLEQRAFRNALRAHGRQLGDARDSKRGTQAIDRLAHEIAFEHWHRMLFARFLAENGLLIHPVHDVAVSIEDCIDLAKEQGQDPWALAASFAQNMLPQLFRKDDPALSVALPTNRRTQIEKLLADLPAVIFTASDASAGAINSGRRSGRKRSTPPATRSARMNCRRSRSCSPKITWWTSCSTTRSARGTRARCSPRIPSWPKPRRARTNSASAVALPGCPWKYLRFIKGKDGKWTPAAGTFDGWPKTAKELKCLDPCMGSGHFVVAMFERLVALAHGRGKAGRSGGGGGGHPRQPVRFGD